MIKRPILILLLLLLNSSSAFADTLGHVPPQLVSYEEIMLTLPAAGLKRARLLVASANGYRIIPMSRISGDPMFKVAVTFGDLAIMKYQFQVETDDGRYLESEYFRLSEPIGSEEREKLEILNAKSQAVAARVLQLKNAVISIEQTDPNELAKRGNKELAKALLTLSEREKERDSLTNAKSEQ